MENLLEKFNMFDLFTMLIPGVIISTLLCISLSLKFYKQWINLGNEKYIAFFVISYLLGICLQQIGNIIDEKFLYKIIYGGNPREIFLLKDRYSQILSNDFVYNDALYIQKYMITYLDINTKNIKNIEEQKQLNARIFSYCLNIIENNGTSFKADKMLVISEMSRSLSLGCIIIIFLNMFIIISFHSNYIFYITESVILLLLSTIFLYRKIQYEQYRYRIILRMFLIYIKNKENK